MKGFLRKVLLIASFGAALTFYGCNKDYGQDIEDVRKDLTAALEEQKSTLTAAINAALEDAKKYAAEADQAIKESAEAYADAAAKQAASEVKAELLTEIQNQVADALADAKKYTDDEISKLKSELSGKIDGIDAEINTIKSTLTEQEGRIAELEKFRTETESRLKTLEAFQEKIEGLNLEEEIAKLNQVIADLQTLRNDFEEAVKGIEEDIDAINTTLDQYKGRLDSIDAAIEDINANLLAIENMIKNRITSISLIPEMYIGGVESINIPALFYTPLAVSDNEAVASLDVVNALPWHTAAAIRYHVSPSNVTADCIAEAQYLTENAAFVKSMEVKSAGNAIMNVVAKEVNKDNELVISAKRVNQENVIPYLTSDFANFEQAKWPTVALSLAIASDYLVDGTEANVVSEYSAYTETAGTIHITPVASPCEPAACNSFYKAYKTLLVDGETLYAGACEGENVIPVVYDATLNLRDLVASHAKLANENFGTIIEDIEVLRSMGLDYRFAIPTEPNLAADGTDQQAFIRFADESNEVVASLVPGGYENNPASIGRTPVVRVELYDVNTNQVVDVQWIKIKWVRESIPAQDFGLIKSFEQILDCSSLFEFRIDWKTINEKILAAGLEMSHEQFVDLYGTAKVSVDAENTTINPATYARAYFVKNTSPVQPQTSVYRITVDYRGLAGIIDEILKDGKASRTVTVRVVPSTVGDTQVGEIKFSVNIDWTLPAELLPSINGYKLTNSWTVAEQLAMVEPIGFSDKTNTNPGVDQFVRYNFNMKGLFNLDTKGGFVANLVPEQDGLDFSCRTWDMQFSSETEGYSENTNLFRPTFFTNPAILYAKDTYRTGYELINKSNRKMAAKFTYPSNVENWYNNDEKVSSIYFSVAKYADNDQVTKLLNPVNVEDNARVKLPVNVWSMLTPAFTNVYKVKTFDMWVVSPVNMPEIKYSALKLVDVNMNVSKVDLPKGFSILNGDVKDFQGNLIDTDAKKAYYGVKEPVWTVTNTDILTDIVIDENNNITVNPDLNPNDYASVAEAKKNMRNLSKAGFDAKLDGLTLTVTNKQGAPLTQTVTFWIPVSYEHAYQKFFVYLPVTYTPNSVTPGN